MNTDKNKHDAEADEKKQKEESRKKAEQELDDEIEQTFPASDPPSYSQPHNDKKKK